MWQCWSSHESSRLKKIRLEAWGPHNHNSHHVNVRPLADGGDASIRHRVCASVLAAMIGGALMGSYSALNATDLDSHANMAVADNAWTVIEDIMQTLPLSLQFFLRWKWSERGRCNCIWWSHLITHFYPLVMRNALLIPTMDHNPSPPFLLREAGLYVDETPKHQIALPVIDNHAIVDSETGMRIHLSLNGIFSCFPRCALTLEEIKD